MARLTPPLSPNLPMVDKDGKPTPFFMRWWQEQVASNAAIADLSTPEAVSAVLDVIGAEARGQILYRGATLWELLEPDTAGKLLVTNGAAADPSWNTLSATIDTAIGGTHGDILFRGAAGWERLGFGTVGDVLSTNGAAADPAWITPSAGGASITIKARYWRILRNASPDPNFVGMSELGWNGTTDGGTVGGVASASSVFSTTFNADKAFDGITTTGWATQASLISGAWIEWDFTTSTAVTEFYIRPGTAPDYTPTDFDLQCSLDGTNWITVQNYTTTWVASTGQSFTVDYEFGGRFTDLIDSPTAFGTTGQILEVNAAGTALEFATPATPGSTTFTGLTDTPANFTGSALLFARVNAGETALEFVAGGGGAAAFTDLTDTPGALGTAGQYIKVNAGATALEFTAAPSGGGGGTFGSATTAQIAVLDLSVTTLATGSEYDIPAATLALYHKLEFRFQRAVSASKTIVLQVSSDDLSTVETSTSAYYNSELNRFGDNDFLTGVAGLIMCSGGTTQSAIMEVTGFNDAAVKTMVIGENTALGNYASRISETVAVTTDNSLRLVTSDGVGYTAGTLEIIGHVKDVGISAGDAAENVVQMTETIFDLSDVGNTLDSGNEIELDITDAYMVVIDMVDGTAGGATRADVQLSTDGGATWLTTSGDYQRWLNNEATNQHSLDDTCFYFNADGTSELGGRLTLLNTDRADKKTTGASWPVTSTQHYHVRTERTAATVENRVRLTSNAGNAFTGGKVVMQVYKRISTTPPVVTGTVTFTQETTVLLDQDLSVTPISTTPQELLDDLTQYDEIHIHAEIFSGGSQLRYQFSPDGGTTWRADLYSRLYTGISSDNYDNSDQTYFVASDGSGNNAGTTTIKHHGSASTRTFKESMWSTGAAGATVFKVDGWQDRLEITNALRFYASGTTISSGVLVVTGVKHVGSASVVATAYDAPYDVGSGFSDVPTTAQVLEDIMIARELVFPADFAGSVGYIGINPTATFDIDVQDDGVSIGTISISTGGAYTFTTVSGTAKTVAAGSRLSFIAPVTVDATASAGVWTLLGTSGVTP